MGAEEVKRAGLDYRMFERVQEAWAWWKEHVPPPARVRVIGDDDSDGITSSYIVGTTLRRAGYDVDIRVMPIHSPQDVHVGFQDARGAYVVLDAGSSVLDAIDSFRVPTLVLDHHRVHDFVVQNTFEVNPRRAGGDKVEHVSTSVIAALFGVAAGNHWDLAFAGVAGGISDRQHLGGFRGLLGHVVEGCLRHGSLASSTGLTLVGATTDAAVSDSLDPYFEPYAGNVAATRTLLARMGIDPAKPPLALPAAQSKALADELGGLLRSKGVVTERMYPLLAEQYPLRHESGVSTIFGLAQLLEALTAARKHETALRLLGGDASAAREANATFQTRLQGIQKEIRRLQGTTQDRPNLRWAETRDPANTGVYAHTLLTYMYGDDKPFVVVSHSGDLAKCSSRGSPRLYGAGVDLSVGMAEAAEAVGGHGGGHPGASGATVPFERRDEFLTRLDAALGRLRRGHAA